MGVRIGISLGAAGVPGEFEAALGLLEAAGVDSLWLPENVYGPTVEPVIGVTVAVAKTTRLKGGAGVGRAGAAEEGVRADGRAVHRDDVRAGQDHAAQGRQRDLRAARPPP